MVLCLQCSKAVAVFPVPIVTCRLLQVDEIMQLLSCLSVLFQGACCLVQYILVFFRLVVKCKVKCQLSVHGKKKKSMSAGGKGIWYPAQLCFLSVFLQESACLHASCSLPLPPGYNTLLPAYEAGCRRHTGQFAVVPEDSCSWSVVFFTFWRTLPSFQQLCQTKTFPAACWKKLRKLQELSHHLLQLCISNCLCCTQTLHSAAQAGGGWPSTTLWVGTGFGVERALPGEQRLDPVAGRGTDFPSRQIIYLDLLSHW